MISPQDFIHPEDEAARRNMEAILGFSAAVKAFLKLGMEQYYHGINMASKIRLSEKQLPGLYRKLPPICQKLNITEPEFYLEMNPSPIAYTFGDTHIFLTQSNLDEKAIEFAEASIFRNCKGTVSSSTSQPQNNKFCTQCGTSNPERAKFCRECRASL